MDNIFDLPNDKDKQLEYYYRVLKMTTDEEEKLIILSKIKDLIEEDNNGEE